MKDLRDPGGSNPLPPVYSRLTDCAGYIFDCGDYGMSRFSIRWSLLELWSNIVIMMIWTILCSAPVWYIELSTAVTVGKLLHSYDWYPLTWFPLNACLTALMSSIDALPLRLSSSPLNLECAACLSSRFDTPHHHDYALPCNWTHNICTMSIQSWPELHRIVIWNMTYDTASGRHTVRENFSKLLNTPKYKSHNRLEEEEKVYLKKKPPIVPSPTCAYWHFQFPRSSLGKNHDVTK